MQTYEQYLRSAAVPEKVIDEFLDARRANWARFDPELGYVLANSMQHDGLDDCWTISTSLPNGARTPHMYADRPCRINTCGDSFTQCHQVSDAETWQEYLAGHLGEPIRSRLGVVNTNCRWGTSAQTCSATQLAFSSARFWWQQGQKLRTQQENGTKSSSRHRGQRTWANPRLRSPHSRNLRTTVPMMDCQKP